MKHNSMKKLLSLLLCVVLAAAMVLTGCAKTDVPADTGSSVASSADGSVIGEGAIAFTFEVTDLDGNVTGYEVHTDKKTVGEALLDYELVAGTVGEWGLMVDTINGLTLDFNKDGMYWAFYIDGEYAQTGVDSTEIVPGAVYSFVPEGGQA